MPLRWWAPPEQLARECRGRGPGVGSLGELALVRGAGDPAPLSAFSAAAAPCPAWLSPSRVGVGGAVGGWSCSDKNHNTENQYHLPIGRIFSRAPPLFPRLLPRPGPPSQKQPQKGWSHQIHMGGPRSPPTKSSLKNSGNSKLWILTPPGRGPEPPKIEPRGPESGSPGRGKAWL